MRAKRALSRKTSSSRWLSKLYLFTSALLIDKVSTCEFSSSFVCCCFLFALWRLNKKHFHSFCFFFASLFNSFFPWRSFRKPYCVSRAKQANKRGKNWTMFSYCTYLALFRRPEKRKEWENFPVFNWPFIVCAILFLLNRKIFCVIFLVSMWRNKYTLYALFDWWNSLAERVCVWKHLNFILISFACFFRFFFSISRFVLLLSVFECDDVHAATPHVFKRTHAIRQHHRTIWCDRFFSSICFYIWNRLM